MEEKYDFHGWVTKNNVRCSDGRTIMKDAFKECDGVTVPLVWNHQYNSPDNVLGHCLLRNRPEGVYGYGKFNDTEDGLTAKRLVHNRDITQLSIYANGLHEAGGNVFHGVIKEVSLVLAGANPGAFIDQVISHSDDDDGGANLWYYASEITEVSDSEISHSDNEEKKENDDADASDEQDAAEDKSIRDIVDSMSEEQQNVMYTLIKAAAESGYNEEKTLKEDKKEMSHSVFDQDGMKKNEGNVLSHSEIETIFKDGKRNGSLKEGFLAHAEEYGISDIDWLFPDAKNVQNTPEFVKRDTGWVSVVMNGVSRSPFSRIKSVFADITADEARAKGYIKGKLKKEEVFSLLKRSTSPTTIYKKQKLDRDDIIDIVDFEVVAWIKAEMRMMLDEEIARAILIGDGRLASDDDHIDTNCIRPIATDAELYVVRNTIELNNATDSEVAKAFIRAVIKARKDYKGSGNPTLFTTEDMLSEMLLLEDGIGHFLYASEQALATAMRVKDIVTVPVMEGYTGVNGHALAGLVVNLSDYKVGADKGGSINMFEDFDIDYNQQKYLIETRCSGALVRPYSALEFEIDNKVGA